MKIKILPEDKLLSEYIRKRANGICEVCGKDKGWKGLQCSHYIGRRNKSVRWDIDNVSAQCFGCHLKFHENPYEHHRWKLNQLGEEKYEALLKRSRILSVGLNKWTKEKLKCLREDLKEKIKNLKTQ